MAKGNVSLNGFGLVCDTFEVDGRTVLVNRERKEPYATAFRTTGIQQQADIINYSSLSYLPPYLGLGVDRIPVDEASNPLFYRRCFNNTNDIRWPGGVFLPLLKGSSVQTNLEVIRASKDFKGNLIGLWEDDTSFEIVSSIYTSSTNTWDGTPNIILSNTVGNETVALDMYVDGDTLVTLMVVRNDHEVFISTDGTSWASTSGITQNLLANEATAHEDIDAGLLISIGGELVAVVWDEANGDIVFDSSTNSGANWVAESGTVNVAIASAGGVKGVAVMSGTDGERKLLVGTEEGIWEVDTAPAVWTVELIWPMSSHKDNCRRMAIGPDGALWFSRGVSINEPFEVYRLFVSNGQWLVTPTVNSPHLQDGLTSVLNGAVHWMKKDHGFMYITVGGDSASNTGTVFCHNGRGWSVVGVSNADIPVEWLEISSADGTTVKLLWAERNTTSTTGVRFLDDIATNPASGLTPNRASSGTLAFPRIDGGMPAVDGVVVEARIAADSLSATTSGEYIAFTYGGDGEGRTTNSLGNFLSGTLALEFGAVAGEGISSRTLAPQVTLHRDAGDITDSPVFRSLEIDYLKKPPEVERFSFLVNIEETANANGIPTEEVISNLEAARDLKVLPILTYGNIGNKFVQVRHFGFSEDFDAETAPDENLQRAGSVLVICEEII